jgi:hypothetical protein
MLILNKKERGQKAASECKQMLGLFWTIRRKTGKTFPFSVYRKMFEMGASQRQV